MNRRLALSVSGHFAPIDHEMMTEASRRTHPGVDRRSLRTRHALHHALIDLIMERGYDAISVADIADAANVGRSTFYVHYTDKDDLLRSGIGYLKTMLIDPPAELAGEGPLRFSRFLTTHLKDQRKLYRALMSSSAGAIVMGTLRSALCDMLRKDLRKGPNQPADEKLIQFVVGGYLSLVTWWLDRGAKESADDIDAAFCRMASPSL
jgi:AcrR family transcriptional regulator